MIGGEGVSVLESAVGWKSWSSGVGFLFALLAALSSFSAFSSFLNSSIASSCVIGGLSGRGVLFWGCGGGGGTGDFGFSITGSSTGGVGTFGATTTGGGVAAFFTFFDFFSLLSFFDFFSVGCVWTTGFCVGVGCLEGVFDELLEAETDDFSTSTSSSELSQASRTSSSAF